MSPEQFCYWLQGVAETREAPIDDHAWECIKQHLALVFTKVTPPGPGEVKEVTPTILPSSKEKGNGWGPDPKRGPYIYPILPKNWPGLREYPYMSPYPHMGPYRVIC